MLAEVLLKREPRSVSDISAPAVIAPTIMVAAVILRRARASFVPVAISVLIGGGGASNFLALTDTPDSYAGHGGKVVVVRTDEGGLEFVSAFTVDVYAIAIALRTASVIGIDSEMDPTDGQALVYDAAADKWRPGTVAPAGTLIRNFVFGLKKSSGLAVGKIAGYWTCPFAGTITAWNLAAKLLPDSEEGTITVKIWKNGVASPGAPDATDSINTAGILLDIGETKKHSTDLSDFTTVAVAVGDVFACEITDVNGLEDFGGSIEIQT